MGYKVMQRGPDTFVVLNDEGVIVNWCGSRRAAARLVRNLRKTAERKASSRRSKGSKKTPRFK